MAQVRAIDNPAISPARLAIEACKNDDVSLLIQAISLASNPESRQTVEVVIQRGLQSSLMRTAPRVLSYMLNHGADVSTVYAFMIGSMEEPEKPSLEILEMLIVHGWNINARRNNSSFPLLWHVLRYPDLVEWCLAQGAGVDFPDDPPARGAPPREPLLVYVATQATVATFELLRKNGAPLYQRALHAAVDKAASGSPPHDSSDQPILAAALFKERMEMVRYLVDVIGFGVNSEEWYSSYCCLCRATPLYYVADSIYKKDVREVTWFLLDRGADPDRTSTMGDRPVPSAIGIAQMRSNTRFLEAVQEWQDRQHNNVKTA
ncbi:hypothetical protein GGI43DRAFT_96452 [Trichoderma evansii]